MKILDEATLDFLRQNTRQNIQDFSIPSLTLNKSEAGYVYYTI